MAGVCDFFALKKQGYQGVLAILYTLIKEHL
jgi:hypothetical protein